MEGTTSRVPDAVCHFVWNGEPYEAEFAVVAAAAAPLGAHRCVVKAVCGTQAVPFVFQLNVDTEDVVRRNVARAAATAARLARAGDAGTATFVWEASMHGLGTGPDDSKHTVSGVGTGAAGAGGAVVMKRAESLPSASADDAASEAAADAASATVADDGAVAVEVGQLPASVAMSQDDLLLDAFCLPLARGGHGEVSLSAMADGRACVVKRPLVHPGDGGDEVVRAFLHEAAVHEQLGQHPNIVTLLGACRSPDAPFIALEYLPLGSLRAALDRAAGSDGHGALASLWDVRARQVADAAAALTPRRELLTSCGTASLTAYLAAASAAVSAACLHDTATRIHLARDAAAGVAAVHAAGMAHRDIAARNILLALDAPAAALAGGIGGNVGIAAKVCDVGLAVDLARRMGGSAPACPPLSPALHRLSSSDGVEMDGYGTANIMAPETLLRNVVSQGGDVYMMGGLLFELFDDAGRQPWAGYTRARIVSELLSPPPTSSSADGSLPPPMPRLQSRVLSQLSSTSLAAMPATVLDVMNRCLSYDREVGLAGDDDDDVAELLKCDTNRPSMADVAAALDYAERALLAT